MDGQTSTVGNWMNHEYLIQPIPHKTSASQLSPVTGGSTNLSGSSSVQRNVPLPSQTLMATSEMPPSDFALRLVAIIQRKRHIEKARHCEIQKQQQLRCFVNIKITTQNKFGCGWAIDFFEC